MTPKEQKQHYNKIANLGCILCIHLGHNGTPAEVHHIRRYGGKRDLAPVIPLCPEHHRGNSGVHGMGKKSFARHYGLDEHDLLHLTTQLLTNPERTIND